ncbi:RTA1 like protein-domain-containing protein [Mycena haematopus]|nr:RTA1 like protein-domain-containing protein [Mycena haematopus]
MADGRQQKQWNAVLDLNALSVCSDMQCFCRDFSRSPRFLYFSPASFPLLGYSMSILPSLLLSATEHRFNPFHYVPTGWIRIIFLAFCVVFVTLCTISTVLHLRQAIRYRIWWLLPIAFVPGLLEILDWSALLWSTCSLTFLLSFELQVINIMRCVASVLSGPTPLIVTDFMILGRIIQRLGRYSRLSPKWYSIIFCSCDIISLSVQGFGGTIASVAVGNSQSPDNGAHIMLAGIIFQMISISIYILLAAEFFLRFFTDKPLGGRKTAYHSLGGRGRGELDQDLRIMIGALAFNTTCLFIRAIYRTIELLDGFSGPIVSTQWSFNRGGVVAEARHYTSLFFFIFFLLDSDFASLADGTNVIEKRTE